MSRRRAAAPTRAGRPRHPALYLLPLPHPARYQYHSKDPPWAGWVRREDLRGLVIYYTRTRFLKRQKKLNRSMYPYPPPRALGRARRIYMVPGLARLSEKGKNRAARARAHRFAYFANSTAVRAFRLSLVSAPKRKAKVPSFFSPSRGRVQRVW